MGLVACQAAYENGGNWLDQCRLYMQANLDFLWDHLTERLPQVKLVEPEGTYFAWLDCSGLRLCRRDLNDLIVNKAKLVVGRWARLRRRGGPVPAYRSCLPPVNFEACAFSIGESGKRNYLTDQNNHPLNTSSPHLAVGGPHMDTESVLDMWL